MNEYDATAVSVGLVDFDLAVLRLAVIGLVGVGLAVLLVVLALVDEPLVGVCLPTVVAKPPDCYWLGLAGLGFFP